MKVGVVVGRREIEAVGVVIDRHGERLAAIGLPKGFLQRAFLVLVVDAGVEGPVVEDILAADFDIAPRTNLERCSAGRSVVVVNAVVAPFVARTVGRSAPGCEIVVERRRSSR